MDKTVSSIPSLQTDMSFKWSSSLILWPQSVCTRQTWSVYTSLMYLELSLTMITQIWGLYLIYVFNANKSVQKPSIENNISIKMIMFYFFFIICFYCFLLFTVLFEDAAIFPFCVFLFSVDWLQFWCLSNILEIIYIQIFWCLDNILLSGTILISD